MNLKTVFGPKVQIILSLLIILKCIPSWTLAESMPTSSPPPSPSSFLSLLPKKGTIIPSFKKLLTTTTSSTTPTNFPELTEPTVPSICIDGIRKNNEFDEDGEKFVEIIEGDAIISVLTKDPVTALFVVNRINHAELINGEFEIGIRAIHIHHNAETENILLQEVEYLQLCVEHPIGIFLDNDLYKLAENLIDDLEYNIWAIPSTRELLFPKVAHLLYQMPWGEKTASVEILAESLSIYEDFMNAVRNEKLCLMHFRSSDNIYVILGNQLVSHFKENGTIFAIPTGRTDKSFISGLPGNSYVLMESEVEIKTLDENSSISTLEESLMGKNILSSELIAIGGPLLDLTRWLNESLMKNCEKVQNVFHMESCFGFLSFVQDWKVGQHHYRPSDIIELLRIKRLSHLMTFEMFQKVVNRLNKSEEHVELREIASQSFITNITTYFHYNQANETNHDMKTKFGQVFNCKYGEGTNRKYPFYFEGESVMYWRLKPETWIAAGLTCAGLGIIICLAILVFIIVRISIGDVFEGNPMSTILLLLSLVLLFGSFVTFALEYVSDHRNSQITYEDADTMNTLCAVRVFLITLCYCLIYSLLLCRALMLASIGSEGGFLSHVNGYIQSVICVFSTLVQIGLSTQLLVVMHIAKENVSCQNIYYGYWIWGLLTYDTLLLLFLILLTPLIFRSQRNYREGILLVVGSILCLIIWCTWIPMAFFGDEWRDAAIPLGMQATGWAILAGIMIPRTFLIVRGIERSDIAQALPSLTSLAFAQNNQYSSEQSVYECVNPAMRHCSSREDGMCEIGGHNRQSPSEIPTLPLRGGGGGVSSRRPQLFHNLRGSSGVGGAGQIGRGVRPTNPNINRRSSYESSEQTSLPPSPNKMTRF